MSLECTERGKGNVTSVDSFLSYHSSFLSQVSQYVKENKKTLDHQNLSTVPSDKMANSFKIISNDKSHTNGVMKVMSSYLCK